MDEAEEDQVKNEFYHMAERAASASSPPRRSPVAMSLKLAVAHFTNGVDVFVQGKYEATFLLVLGKAKQLMFEGMGWVTEVGRCSV